jgi:hypothetical protein
MSSKPQQAAEVNTGAGLPREIGALRGSAQARADAQHEAAMDLQGDVVLSTVHRKPSLREDLTPDKYLTREKPRATRGKCQEFSAGSRRRALRILYRMDWEDTIAHGLGKFISATYPREVAVTAKLSKAHLEAFRRAFEREYPGCWGFWRLAPQSDGTVHYHFIMGGIRWVRLRWLRRVWGRIIGYDGSKLLQVDVSELRSVRYVRSYVSKYIAKLGPGESAAPVGTPEGEAGAAAVLLDPLSYPDKPVETWAEPGRFWGLIKRDLVPWAKRLLVTLPIGPTFHAFKRLMRKKWARVNGNRYEGGMVYGAAEQWARALAWCAWEKSGREPAWTEGVMGFRKWSEMMSGVSCGC